MATLNAYYSTELHAFTFIQLGSSFLFKCCLLTDSSQNMCSITMSVTRAWCGPVWPLCTSLSWSPLNFSSMCPCHGCPWNYRTESDVNIADYILSFTPGSSFQDTLTPSYYFLSKQHSPGAYGGSFGDSRSFCHSQWTIPDEILRHRGVSQKVISPVIYFTCRLLVVDQMFLLLLNSIGHTLCSCLSTFRY